MTSRVGRRGVTLAAVGVLILAVAGLAVAFHRSSTHEAGRRPTLAEIQRVLDAHATAVAHHSLPAFLAGIDTSKAAAPFRSAQRASFENMSGVPFTSWSYKIADAVNGPTENSDAATRYGAPAQLVHVDFSYSLRYVDPAPSTQDLYLTFVRRDGRILIAGDSDLAAFAGQSWRGPWDYGPVDVYRGASSLVLAHPDNAALMPRLAAVLDSAVQAVSAVWGTGWKRQVALVVPDTQAEMSQVLHNDLALDQIAAATYVSGVDATTNSAVGVRIAVNPANLDRLDAVGLQIVLRHEVTLAATWAAKSDASPTWLTEGFAEYVANLGTGQTVPFAASELAKDVKAGKLPTALPTVEDFQSDSSSLAQTYELSWLACRLIATEAGQAGLVMFFRQVGASDLSAEAGDGAVVAALASVIHQTPAQFITAWRHYLVAELG